MTEIRYKSNSAKVGDGTRITKIKTIDGVQTFSVMVDGNPERYSEVVAVAPVAPMPPGHEGETPEFHAAHMPCPFEPKPDPTAPIDPTPPDPTPVPDPVPPVIPPIATPANVVNSLSGIAAALAMAAPGDVIGVAPGIYGELRVRGFVGSVQIVPSDPANPPEFHGIVFENCTGLVLDGVRIKWNYTTGAANWSYPNRIHDCKNCGIIFSEIEGSDSDTGWPFSTGIVVRRSTGTMIKSNRIHNIYRGIVIEGSQDGVYDSNKIFDVGSDAITGNPGGTVMVNNSFQRNNIHDFRDSPTSGAHRDCITIWGKDAANRVRGLIISYNVIDIGGGIWSQMIFGPDPMISVKVEYNIGDNFHHHGITLGACTGLAVNGNVVRQKADNTVPGNTDLGIVNVPKINLQAASTNASAHDNTAPFISGIGAGWAQSNNIETSKMATA